MRSQALATGIIQYSIVLGLGLILAVLSCCMACAVGFLNRLPKEKRYHADNSLPWDDLVIARPQNGKMWEVLGWTKASWEGDEPALYPRSESNSWSALGRTARGGRFNETEQQAASFLGFTQPTWDMDDAQNRDLAARGGDQENYAFGQQDDLVEAVLA